MRDIFTEIFENQPIDPTEFGAQFPAPSPAQALL